MNFCKLYFKIISVIRYLFDIYGFLVIFVLFDFFLGLKGLIFEGRFLFKSLSIIKSRFLVRCWEIDYGLI